MGLSLGLGHSSHGRDAWIWELGLVGGKPSGAVLLCLVLALVAGPHGALLRWLGMGAKWVAGMTGPCTMILAIAAGSRPTKLCMF